MDIQKLRNRIAFESHGQDRSLGTQIESVQTAKSDPRLAWRAGAIALLLLTSAPIAQGLAPVHAAGAPFPGGTFANFESAHVKPLALAELGDLNGPDDYLLVCNTDANALEVFDLNLPGAPVAVARLRVGLHPVSVIWRSRLIENPSNPGEFELGGDIYTANVLGDSVTRIELVNSTFGVKTPQMTFLRTKNVGDEPTHIAVTEVSGTPELLVTLNTRTAYTRVDALTLATITQDPHRAILGLNVPVDLDFNGSIDPASEIFVAAINRPSVIFRVDEPQPMVFILGARGTHHDWGGANQYSISELGFDLWGDAEANTLGTGLHVSSNWRKNLGTTNFNMTFDQDGACWVVSGDAANRLQKLKTNVNSEPTGFLRSLLHVIPTPGVSTSPALTRDINRDSGGFAVPALQSLSHATDVAVYNPDPTLPDLYTVYVTSTNNSAFGVITGVKNGGGFTPAASWSRARVTIPSANFPGPTGIVVKYANGGAGDSGDRFYILNRFDNQVVAFDPTNNNVLVGTTNLQESVTPLYITTGRRFLYSAQVGNISNGFNACSSCHTEGRTDGLSWDLGGVGAGGGAVFSLEMISTLESGVPVWNMTTNYSFSQPKGEFITQSLQGLVNYEVKDTFANGTWFSNAPYHWDMDMPDIASFDTGGFKDLLGGGGLTGTEMTSFTKLVNSIHYPPNYEQPKQRYSTGDLGVIDEDQDITGAPDGSGSLYGLKLFHTKPLGGVHDVCFQRSCVQCHDLPDGSNNLGTEGLPATRDPIARAAVANPSDFLPIETAALRGLAQKEIFYLGTEVPNVSGGIGGLFARYYVLADTFRYMKPPAPGVDLSFWYNTLGLPYFGSQIHLDIRHSETLPAAILPSNGILHEGQFLNINEFLTLFHKTGAYNEFQAAQVSEFVRQFDTGMAPMVGHSLLVDTPNITINSDISNPTGVRYQPGTTRSSQIADLMEQVRVVNCGLAVTGQLFGGPVGLYYIANRAGAPGGPGWFVSSTTGAIYIPSTLLSFVGMNGGDSLVFTSTPLGMARRIATPATTLPFIPGVIPTEVVLETMVPMTGYEIVPSMQKNVDPSDLRLSLYSGPMAFNWNGPDHTPWDEKSFRILQAGYKNSVGSPPQPSTTRLTHEPSRRFRVAGKDILPGAVLMLSVPRNNPSSPDPDWLEFELPIFASDKVNSSGNRIWETAVEVDKIMAGVFANGGWYSPGIDQMQSASTTSVLTRKNTVVVPFYAQWDHLNTLNIFNRTTWNNYRIRVINESGAQSAYVTGQPINIEPAGWTH